MVSYSCEIEPTGIFFYFGTSVICIYLCTRKLAPYLSIVIKMQRLGSGVVVQWGSSWHCCHSKNVSGSKPERGSCCVEFASSPCVWLDLHQVPCIPPTPKACSLGKLGFLICPSVGVCLSVWEHAKLLDMVFPASDLLTAGICFSPLWPITG